MPVSAELGRESSALPPDTVEVSTKQHHCDFTLRQDKFDLQRAAAEALEFAILVLVVKVVLLEIVVVLVRDHCGCCTRTVTSYHQQRQQ